MKTPIQKKQKPLPLSAGALRHIERRGITRHGLKDLYHALMTMRLAALLGVLAGAFVSVNLVFGMIFFLVGGLGGIGHGGFWDAFFFSAQTLSTTGYGAIYPVSRAANAFATLEILLGLLGTALATGVLFARLSRPQARVLFSRVMVVSPFQGTPALMFRLVNERRNQIVEARIAVTFARDEDDGAGGTLRRLVNLKLERDHTPVFALSWLVMHRITPESPFFGLDAAALARAAQLFVCTLTGIDDTLRSAIYARHVYGVEDIRFGHRFVDVITRNEAGAVAVDYRRFHDTISP